MHDCTQAACEALREQARRAADEERQAAAVVEAVVEENARRLNDAKGAYRHKKVNRVALERMIATLERTQQSVTKSDVLQRTMRLLAENPQGVRVDELKPLVKESLRDAGFVLTGAFRHWDKWVSELEGVVIENGCYCARAERVSVASGGNPVGAGG